MKRRTFIISMLGVLLSVVGVSIYLVQKPAEVTPKTSQTTPTLTPTLQVKAQKELHLEGSIARSSGDTNPIIGTPWLDVGCTASPGKPIITVDAEILDIFNNLKKAGLKPGQNITYTGQEELPEGSHVKIFVEWAKTRTDLSTIIFDRKTGKSLNVKNESFVFLGSHKERGELCSERTGCIACTVNCPYSLFAVHKSNSGYLRERSRYYIPEGILPESGTKVTVIISWK